MNKKIFVVAVMIAFILVVRAVFGANASPAPQVLQFATPTPGADGRIIYIVKAGDSCSRISLLMGISVDQIRQLNGLDEACTLTENQPLFIGQGGPAQLTPTPGPSPTPLPIQPTATPETNGSASVCVLLYEDLNGDSLRQEIELGIEGGSVSLASTNGVYSQTLTTISEIDPDTEEPALICFTDVPKGDYTISMGIPEGYNATTALSVDLTGALAVQPGGTFNVPFGAQLSTAPVTSVETAGRSPTILWLGGILLLAGGGLAFLAYRSGSGTRRMKYK